MARDKPPRDESFRDDEEDHLPAYWNRGEKKRTMVVVKSYEARSIINHALKRMLQITTAILAFIGTAKLAGIGTYWSAFVTWMGQK